MATQKVGGVLRKAVEHLAVPGVWRVEVRLHERDEEEIVSKVVELAFGASREGEMAVVRGAACRVVLRIGRYPREIAEARAEAMKARAALGGTNLDVCIKRIEAEVIC